jgi:APA family basic amino acid/polyamine antiporter
LSGEQRGHDAAPHELCRRLTALDAALLTIGSVVGTGIFLTAGDVAEAVPHAGLILLVWLGGGAFALAGALTLAEPASALPRAGGLYLVLREAFGPLFAFLYGWTAFLVIMSGGLAAIAMGGATCLAAFVPGIERPVLVLGDAADPAWTLTGNELAALVALALLTAVNHLGVGPGAWVQNGLTWLKVAAIVGFAAAGLCCEPRAENPLFAPLPGASDPAGLAAGLGAAMIAALWTYDGWYGVTFEAGELRDPSRSLPRGLTLGVLAVIALYLLLNLFLLRALPLSELAGDPRAGEHAARALLGPRAAQLFAALVVVSSFGCLAATILYSARIYLPMARDGVFFAAVGRVHPRFRTPHVALWAQAGWAALLLLSGTYSQLYTYVTFASVLFLGACGAAALVLRRTRPDLPRPWRTWGWPWVPLAFLAGCAVLTVSTLRESPKESLAGLGLAAAGLPAYAWWAWWRRRPSGN